LVSKSVHSDRVFILGVETSRLFLEFSREAPIQPSHSHSLPPADPPIFSPQKLRRLLTFPQLFAKIVIPKEHETLFARDVVILELLPCTMPPTSLFAGLV
jgi:hypothetical protein